MKRTGNIMVFAVMFLASAAYASQTRMDILMAGDYVDDIVNIRIYPHHLLQYQNSLYADLKSDIEDYGMIMAPLPRFGAFGVWQDAVTNRGFHIGYAISLKKFEIGISGSPGDDQTKFSLGIGRLFFDKRFDASLVFNDTQNEEWYMFNLRIAKRKDDYIIIPRYSFSAWSEPYEYNRHRIGIMLQRIIFNDGFVFFIAEYDMYQGDIESDNTHIHAGLDLPVSRKIALLLGVKENFTDGFESPVWTVEPGISVRIRDFTLDFHLNQERLYNRDVTLFNSFGLELNFGRF
jgi:hypothetical protein